MNIRQLALAVVLVFAASCGGGGDTAAVAAPASATSETILAFDVNGTSADNPDGSAPLDPTINGTGSAAFSISWQVESAAEAHRVRLYYSANDILGDRDQAFYDATCAPGAGCGSMNPYTASCVINGAGVSCDGQPGTYPSSNQDYTGARPFKVFFIARVCRVDNFDCKSWPRLVEFR